MILSFKECSLEGFYKLKFNYLLKVIEIDFENLRFRPIGKI